MDKGKR